MRSGFSGRAPLVPSGSAASASKRIGLAMVFANTTDRATLTSVAMMKTCRMTMRSFWTMALMSSPWVDSTNTPSTALKRLTGMATETIISPLLLIRTAWLTLPRAASRSVRVWVERGSMPYSAEQLDEIRVGVLQAPEQAEGLRLARW